LISVALPDSRPLKFGGLKQDRPHTATKLMGPEPNLDRWISQFLKRKSFARKVAFFGEARDRLDEIWR